MQRCQNVQRGKGRLFKDGGVNPSVHQYHPVGDVTRVSVMLRKDTVKIGDDENRCRGCRDKNR